MTGVTLFGITLTGVTQTGSFDWYHNDWCHLTCVTGVTVMELSKFHSAVTVLSPLSRLNLDAEWMIDSSVLSKAFSHLDIEPTIDLSASRINKQLPCYISYRPDAEAYAVDAFSVSWKGFYFYAFPPFSLIPRVLQKIRVDNCSGVLVVPVSGKTQVWRPSSTAVTPWH